VSRGLLIVDLDAGTPAARSGLRTGDVILAVDGETVETLADFRSLISLPAPSYDLEVARRGERMRLALRH
jgi:S1-C subfamily serine protease